MSNYIPIIETQRLLLVNYELQHFPEMLRLYQDPIATKYVPPGPLSREACWALWLQYQGSWAALGFGYWAIKEKSTQAFIGEIGFLDLQRETVPPLPSMLEMGTMLHSDYHGHGYGHEAKCAIFEWQQEKFDRPVCCLILPENLVAIKQAKKFGFTFDDQITYGEYKLCLGLIPK